MLKYFKISTIDQAQDIRQSIVDTPNTFQYSCFHLEVNGERIPDFVDMSEVSGINDGCELTLVEDAYTEKDARIHFLRIRELIGASGNRTDLVQGIQAGVSLLDHIATSSAEQESASGNLNSSSSTHPLSDYDVVAPGSYKSLLQPPQEPAPKTVRSISLSPWNPAPYHLRLKGHLLYVQLTTLEGEQFQISATVSGFFVNKSSNNKFDPFPRTTPKTVQAHSLLTLISKLSPGFDAAFTQLQEHNSKRDPLAMFQPSNSIPASPWLVPKESNSLSVHQSDVARSQESYLISGAESTETLRDWNEEFQTTRELPKETVQDRVFRERVTNKLFADYNEAATQGAVLIARGEVAPVNPTENRDAQIFVYNNVFYSFGADGVGTFASEGGDEAARIATGKDVNGVRSVNQLDIPGLCAPGTVVVDYLGKRIVGQSIVPGIFKQREPGEQQIDYGGVEGKDIVAENAAFVPLFQKLSEYMHVKKHAVWDKEGKKHDLEASVETKGLLGTDGRKYVLDLYRVTPLDIPWIEKHWIEPVESDSTQIEDDKKGYPHRMTVLRPELIDTYWRVKLREYARAEMAKNEGKADSKALENGVPEEGPSDKEVPAETGEAKDGDDVAVDSQTTATASSTLVNGNADNDDKEVSSGTDVEKETEQKKETDQHRVDLTGFKLAFNPDVFSGQIPQTEEEKAEWAQDEAEVRAACDYLQETVLPGLVADLKEGEVGFPMDGQSLSGLLHRRGINIRYLGRLAEMAGNSEPRLQALRALVVQEMVSRAFKHVANRYLKYLPSTFAAACLAHLLNCLIGIQLNDKPQAVVDEDLMAMYPEAKFDFTKVTPEGLVKDITGQISLRYRYDLQGDWPKDLKPVVMLREIALKLGLQLGARDYAFNQEQLTVTSGTHQANGESHGVHVNGTTSTSTKKKSKKTGTSSPAAIASPTVTQTFYPDDIYNIVPILKETAPKSVLAEEALEAGRVSIIQDQRELGTELLLESLSLHEQIYGILHPEVARIYYSLSTLFYSALGDKPIALELARKAVIVAERTLGPDAHETVLSYLNLGLTEHGSGNTFRALSYIRHALELWKVVYGPDHPDSITTLNNAAVMLQNLKRYHDSRLWFEASLQISETVSGKSSVNTATLLFQLAQALALDQDPNAAVARMREARNIFNTELGAEDRNTKEAATWLDQLTQNAVSIAKNAKYLEERRRRGIAMTPRVTMEARPQRGAGQSHRDVSGVASSTPASNGTSRSTPPGFEAKSVDELVKYIEGGAEKKQTPKKKTANPRRRAQKS
jgi:protein TIF31